MSQLILALATRTHGIYALGQGAVGQQLAGASRGQQAPLVHLAVLCEMIRASKALCAIVALVGLDARVGATVAGELVGAREAPAAVRPIAGVRLLAHVPAQMGFKVGGLGIKLLTAAKCAQVALLACSILAELHGR